MQITRIIEELRQGKPLNFIWGSGCSGLYRASITFPADPEVREAVKKYDSDPLLSQIKRNFFHKTAGLEDAHSCLSALNAHERKQVLTCRTNWANICMAELLRLGRVARVLTTNFDNSLVKSAATLKLMPPLYRSNYPELQDAATPCIYLLGDTAPATFAGLLRRGAETGPWIVIGCSGKAFGLSQSLLSVDRYEHGLYWVGHFHKEPPEELRSGFFTPERKAQWISGFDADSFMAYLLRSLGAFPPPSLIDAGQKRLKATEQMGTWLRTFESRQKWDMDIRPALAGIERIKRAGTADVRAFVDKVSHEYETAFRLGYDTLGIGLLALNLARHRSPHEVKPLLLKAAEVMETQSAGDVMGNFAEVCRKLACFSYGDHARDWYARADAAFAQMDFGPACGAPVPHGHLTKWAQLLAEWACFEPHPNSEAIFQRAKLKFLETIARRSEAVEEARRREGPTSRSNLAGPLYRQGVARSAESAWRDAIVGFISALQQRARMVASEPAQQLLNEARLWLEKLQSEGTTYTEFLAKHLFREAEAAPDRQATLLVEAGEQFQILLRQFPDQSHVILSNWGSALGELAMARSGEEALRLYAEADLRFQDLHKIKPDLLPLHKNWSSVLLREARERGGPPSSWDRAREHGQRADALESGEGGYNLACIAAEMEDPEGVSRWLAHSAAYGKIPRLSHILEDVNFQRFRNELWFHEVLDGIFDTGQPPSRE